MLCRKPYLPPGQVTPVPCGKCMPCRIKQRRLWTSRLLLESMLHSEQCFVTLTYEDAKLPPSGDLQPVDVVLWLKRLRKRVFPVALRYYLVGEYGEHTWRPHYHALLFGIPFNERSVALVTETWGHGFVQVGDVTPASIRYTVGYVLKKMTKKGDPRLNGRVPEFARMSRSGGIGKDAALAVVRSFLATPAALAATTQVPSVLRMGRQKLMLGKYLREIISRELNIPLVDEKRREAYLAELFDLQASAPAGASLEEAVMEPQAALNVETRERLFSSRRKF